MAQVWMWSGEEEMILWGAVPGLEEAGGTYTSGCQLLHDWLVALD